MSVGARIAELRKAKGWTQSRLAKVAEFSASAIAMYETNRRVPDPTVLEKLAGALETTTEHLCGAVEMSRANPVPTAATREKSPSVAPNEAVTLPSPVNASGINLTTFTLNREEARFILFLRMNPQCRPFLEFYVLADEQKRQQLERTWRLIHDFQK
jgi:transcriptional regulator with XRE-family HTH domain